MSFVVVCPNCDARLRVPSRKRGSPIPCPKCQETVPLPPADDPPDEPVEPPEGAAPVAVAPPVTAVPPPVHEHPDDPLRMALAGVGLFGAAVLAAQFPYGRIIGLVLAVGGAALGGLSLLGLEKRVWLGWAGAAANGLVALLLVALPTWIGATTWVPADDPNAGPKHPVAIDRDGNTTPAADAVDASAAAWQHADVRVSVAFATVGPDPAATTPPKKKEKKERFIWVGVKITNVGVGRAIAFKGWDAGTPTQPKLTTTGRATPARPTLAPGERATLYPGKSFECLLAFEAVPLDADEGFLLELPAAAFDDDAPVRFRIPRAMVVVNR